MLSKKLHQEIYFCALAYLCFSVPFMSKLLPFTLGLGVLLLNWIVEGELLLKVKKSVSTPWVLLFVVFYLLHLFSASYSINHAEAHRDLILKLPILLLPLVLPAIALSSKQKNKLFGFWIIACMLMSCWLLLQAYFSYVETGLVKSWFYTDLASARHPAYFSMYCVTAIILLHTQKLKKRVLFLVQMLLMIMVLLLSSRMQLLALGGVLVIFLSRKLLFDRSKSVLSLVLTVLVSSIFVISNETIQKKSRIVKIQDELSQTFFDGGESVRTMIWKNSIDIIGSSWFLGFGVGCENEELNKHLQTKVSLTQDGERLLTEQKRGDSKLMEVLAKTAKMNNVSIDQTLEGYVRWKMIKDSGNPYDKFYMHHYNYHNQFLQSWATSGILCLLVLMLIFFHLVRKGLVEKNYLILSIALLVAMSFLSESMLERQYGVIYFTLVLGLLFTPESKHA